MKKSKTILAVATSFIVAIATPLLTMATDDNGGKYGMTLSPTSQKILLTPGEEYRSSVRITNPNESEQTLNYLISVAPFSQTGSEGSADDYDNVDTATKTSYNQIVDWITFDKTSGSVEPNESETVSYTISVPEDAPAGGQYATILATDNTNYDQQKEGVLIKSISQIGTILYAEVAGETRETGIISDNNIPSFLLDGSLEATSMVENTGNVHGEASYTFQVWPLGSNEEICTNEENPSTSLILPETKKYHTETCQLPSVGIFNAKQTVTIFGETSVVEKMIIVCPIWLLFVIFFVIAAIIIWLVMRIRNRNKSSKRQSTTKTE